MSTRKLIGHADVDSGQLLICDPCYIKSEGPDRWTEDADWNVKYSSKKKHYVNANGTEISKKQLTGLNYKSVSLASLSEKFQLNHSLGHPGAGVCFGSGYGDGSYPVYATFDDGGRVIRVTVEMG